MLPEITIAHLQNIPKQIMTAQIISALLSIPPIQCYPGPLLMIHSLSWKNKHFCK